MEDGRNRHTEQNRATNRLEQWGVVNEEGALKNFVEIHKLLVPQSIILWHLVKENQLDTLFDWSLKIRQEKRGNANSVF